MDLATDIVREILKYSPWKSQKVCKSFNHFIDDDDSRFLMMELGGWKKYTAPFFNEKFLTPKENHGHQSAVKMHVDYKIELRCYY